MTVADRTPPPALTPPRSTLEEIAALVAAFERCDLPREAWTHRAHLLAAVWYLATYGIEDGVERVRSGIQRFNAAKGVAPTPTGGYHETITRFYLWAVRCHLREAPRDATLVDLANGFAAAWADKNRIFDYYSRDRLFSAEARRGWVEPDLIPLG
jgi:hypothetical protein